MCCYYLVAEAALRARVLVLLVLLLLLVVVVLLGVVVVVVVLVVVVVVVVLLLPKPYSSLGAAVAAPAREAEEGAGGAVLRIGPTYITWVLIKGGCSRRGVQQWIGVVLYSKIVHNTIQITTPCFHCTPLCRM